MPSIPSGVLPQLTFFNILVRKNGSRSGFSFPGKKHTYVYRPRYTGRAPVALGNITRLHPSTEKHQHRSPSVRQLGAERIRRLYLGVLAGQHSKQDDP